MGMLAGERKSELPKMIKHWCDRLNISFALDRKLKTYSKGMLQRVGFASTCLHRPELLILDEPLSGLDPIGRKEFKDAMIELSKEGKSIFFSSHIVSDVEEICKEVVILEQGKLVYSGGINSFIKDNSRNFFELKILKNIKEIPTQIMQYVTFENNELYLFKIPFAEKEKTFNFFMQHIESIYSMVPEKPTLEEVVYKVRSYESRA
jgi:ABC-2 type transport system ATP-binding protein